MDKINQIKKEIIISMKMMDTTIKNVKESEEYKIAQAYNQGLRDAMAIFEREMKRWFTILRICYKERCITVRIKDGNYIAIFYDRMIEVKADSKRDAYNKAKRYFESREHRELFDNELKVCKIPSMIYVLDE